MLISETSVEIEGCLCNGNVRGDSGVLEKDLNRKICGNIGILGKDLLRNVSVDSSIHEEDAQPKLCVLMG